MNTMPKSSEREDILAFLKEPAHLDAAWDLAALFPDVVDELNLKFWKTLKERVSLRLDAMSKPAWGVALSREEDEHLLEARWIGLELNPTDPAPQHAPFYVSPYIQQEYPAKARGKVSDLVVPALHYGIGFSKEINEKSLEDRVPAEADKLAEQLEREDFQKRYESGWLARKDLPYKIRTRADTVALASGDTLEDQLATTFFVFFEKHREVLEKINGKIAKSR